MDLAKVYPYVVPAGYITPGTTWPDGLILPLGHDVFVMPVHDLDGMCRNVLPEEFEEEGLSPEALHQLALENLESLAQGKTIQRSMHQGPRDTRFILWSDHWLAASCIRLAGLHAFAAKNLDADTVCVSIPQREAMLLFPLGTRAQRDEMRAVIRANEEGARKPISWDLFTLSASGLQALVE